MKIQYIKAWGLAILLGCSSCNLDMPPISYIAEDFFFEDATQVNAAVVGCYSGMQGTIEHEWVLTELRTDNTRLAKNNTSTEANLQLVALDQGVQNSNNLNIRNYWDAAYRNINNCNTVLNPKNISVVTEEGLRRQFIGEVTFIRAYQYFNLVRLFGPVFIVNENITVAESMKKDRSSVEEVYGFIIDDLKQAVESLQGIQYDKSQLGRIDEIAAKALLAKVYLTLYRNEDARPLLSDIINVKGTSLIAYDKIFDVNNEMNDEIIFAVRYKKGNLGIGSPFANKFAPLNSYTNVITGSGDGLNYPTTDLINAYTVGDKRKDVSLAEFYIDESKANPIIPEAYVKKYLSPVSVRYDAENDWPVIRYADVLLMYAEVLNELEGPGNALSYLNLTRERAGLSPLDASAVASRYEFRKELDKERRLEFAFENQRWFDLLRWNTVKEVVNNHLHTAEWFFYSGYNNKINELKDYQLILPIPQSVIDINGNVITQNPNY